MTEVPHPWKFFRAGNVVQVDIRSPLDLEHLADLDQKLWMALSMPTRGLSGDRRVLEVIDSDQDGHIRPPEILAAVQWLCSHIKDLRLAIDGKDSLSVDQFKQANLLAAARRVRQLSSGQVDGEIALIDVDRASAELAAEVFNGDGVLVPEATTDTALAVLIQSIVVRYDSVPDRSGKVGINREIISSFYADLEGQLRWFAELDHDPTLLPLDADSMDLAYESLIEVRSKIEDFFARSRWVTYDPRAQLAANRLESDLHAVAAVTLSAEADVLAQLPLAQVQLNAGLPLDDRLNPAWHAAMRRFIRDVLQAFWPEVSLAELSYAQWLEINRLLAPYGQWRIRRPSNKLSSWPFAELQAVPSPSGFQDLLALIDRDAEVAVEFDELKNVQKALILTRDLVRVLRNYVNFADFYSGRGAMFQAGTLFLDGRATELCIDVNNAPKHVAMASLSGAYLVYCDCFRTGSPNRNIVAALTAGDSDNLIAGRNGIFYDREGLDWDVTITRIVANPISMREAFWLPYKKLARFVEEQIAKRAASAEASSSGHLTTAAATVLPLDLKDKPSELANSTRKMIDVGTVAAIGVALGSIGTVLSLVFSKFIDLGLFMPFGIIALVILVSGPSMLLAWLKLRNRNLGPILDANGWAINSKARINVPFAASLTRVRTLPFHAGAALADPYEEKVQPWKFYGSLATILFIVLLWGSGRCDRYLPIDLQSHEVITKFRGLPAAATIPQPGVSK